MEEERRRQAQGPNGMRDLLFGHQRGSAASDEEVPDVQADVPFVVFVQVVSCIIPVVFLYLRAYRWQVFVLEFFILPVVQE